MYRLAAHQEYAVQMMMYSDKLALFYKPGTGKTMCALTTIFKLWKRGEVHNALVVCPASLVGNWKKSIDKMKMFEGFPSEEVDELKEIIHVTSFQKMYKSEKISKVAKNGDRKDKKVVHLRPEVDHEWDIVIVDESHAIGSHSSVQTKVMLALAPYCKRRYIMTGTPVTGGGGKEDFQKLFGQLSFLDPGVFKNWTDFCSRYVVSYDRWHKPRNYRTTECRTLMQNYGIFALLEDCYDLPESTDTLIPCELAEKGVYKDFKESRWLQHGVDIIMAGTQYPRFAQICSGSLKRDDGKVTIMKCSKDAVLADLLNGTDDKVVVFCNLRASIDRCAEIGRKCGRDVVIFDGRSKGDTWEEFQNGPKNMIICQYQAGGAGLDLYASHTMIFFEPTFSALLLEQSVARIMRTGQKNNCTYYYLTTPHTFEDDMWTLVRNGVSITNTTMEELARGITPAEIIQKHLDGSYP